jgi:hypothetical protein
MTADLPRLLGPQRCIRPAPDETREPALRLRRTSAELSSEDAPDRTASGCRKPERIAPTSQCSMLLVPDRT